MFKRFLRNNAVPLVIVLLLAGAAFSIYARDKPFEIGQDNRAAAQQYFAAAHFQEGTAGKTVLKEGDRTWISVSRNENAELLFDPLFGQIQLRELGAGGRIWSSSPSEEELALDGTKGTWSTGLRSPFVFSFVLQDTVNEKLSNPVVQKAEIGWKEIQDGVGISYDLAELGFRFYIEYKLTEDGFTAAVPEHGILESKDNRLTKLELLPFFAAVRKGTSEGYLLVPDGPGGLITFNKSLIPGTLPYDYPVYGFDPAIPFYTAIAKRSDIRYPVFGLKSGEDGFIGIIEQGEYNANIVASPAGIDTGFYRINAKFPLRRLYQRAASLTNYVQSFENNLYVQEIQVRYILLNRGQADYVAMAQTYQQYLSEHRQAKLLAPSGNEPPLMINAIMSAGKPAAFGSKLVVATTLEQLEQIAMELKSSGVGPLRIGLAGWNKDGYPGNLPQRFPVEQAIGGNAGLERLIDKLKLQGISILLHDTYHLAVQKKFGGFSISKEGAYEISGKPVRLRSEGNGDAKDYYVVTPRAIYDNFKKSLQEYAKLHLDGVSITGLGDVVYSDFQRSHPIDREETAGLFTDMLDETRSAVGYVEAGSSAYVIGHADHLNQFPITGNGDLIIDTTVPFYPIAVHGLATYSAMPGNQRNDPRNDFLKGIEYGVLPSYTISSVDAWELNRTAFADYYQTKFSTLKGQILEEYEAYKQTLESVWDKRITGHRQVAEGVYETVYETGKSVWVNYNNKEAAIEGVKLAPKSFAVVQQGGQQNDGTQ